MKELFLAIQAYLIAAFPNIYGYSGSIFVRLWNNQVQLMKDETNEAQMYPFPLPAIFIEFLNDNEITQLGNGVQMFDPLTVRLHIVDNEFDSMDGCMEQNLNILTLKQQIYASMQGFEPNGAVAFVRTQETQDYDHSNVYHFIQDYQTNYVDFTLNRPVNGIAITKVNNVVITPEIDTHL